MLGFRDETWWTRLAQPDLSAWAGEQPLRLHRNPRPATGEGPQAVACYGVLRLDTGGVLLRFVDGRPVRQVTEDFLAWVPAELAREGKTVFVLVWDNAAWHVSKRVAAWIDAYNRRVGRDGGCAITVCGLPVKAPWLNRIEPKWVHAKRAIVEPDRKLSAAEIKQRVCDHFGCQQRPDLKQAA